MAMQTDEIQDIVKCIKRKFPLMMNGVASSSMRGKGVGGYLNWGIQLPALKELAGEYGKNYDLAIALWKENVRECKILATLIMPYDKMKDDLVSLWMEQTNTQEIAEYATFNLYQYLENASLYAFVWIASDNIITQICGFNLFSCLFKRGHEPEDRDINEFIDQSIAALSDDSLPVRHAAMNSLNCFAAISDMHEKVVDHALKKRNSTNF